MQYSARGKRGVLCRLWGALRGLSSPWLGQHRLGGRRQPWHAVWAAHESTKKRQRRPALPLCCL